MFCLCSSCPSVWQSWVAGSSSRQMPLHAPWAKPPSSTLPSSSSTRTTWASPWLTGCSPCGTIPTLPSWSASERWATSSRTDGAGRGSGDRCLLQRASADRSWPCDAPWSFSTYPPILFYLVLVISLLAILSVLFPLKLCFKQNQNISAQASLKDTFSLNWNLRSFSRDTYHALAERNTSGQCVFSKSYCQSAGHILTWGFILFLYNLIVTLF